MLQICQKFHLNSKMYCKQPVTVLMSITGMSDIFQLGLQQVLLKHRDYIASSLEVVGSDSNEPVYCELNEPLPGLVRFYFKSSLTVLMLIKGMSVIFQQGLKPVLLKHCDIIVSSLEIVGSGIK